MSKNHGKLYYDLLDDNFWKIAGEFDSMGVQDLTGDNDSEVMVYDMYAAIECLKELPYQPTPLEDMQKKLDQIINDYFGGEVWFNAKEDEE